MCASFLFSYRLKRWHGPSRQRILAFCLSSCLTITVAAHDSFLRPSDFFTSGLGPVRMAVFNGTYNESVDSIAEDFVQAVHVLQPSGVVEEADFRWERGEAGSKAWRALQRLKVNLGAMDLRRTSTLGINLEEEGITVVMVTHNPDLEQYADRILYLRNGLLESQALNYEQQPLEYDEYIRRLNDREV